MAETVAFAHGTGPEQMPMLGFGTYPLTGQTARDAVAMALEAGYRHVDTAQMYENEAAVGAGLRDSGLPRSEIYVVSKVLPDHYGADRFADSVRRSLDDIGVECLDLLLLHWPPAEAEFDAVLDRLFQAHADGHCHAVGVSNFTIAMMERACARAPVPIVTNQVEFHPLLDQSSLQAAADRLGVTLSAYCALARGEAIRHPTVQEVARSLDRTPAQIVLRWIVQQGVVAVSMTTKPANAAANLEAMDFELSDEAMARLSALRALNHRLVSPEGMAPDWDG